LIYYDGTTELSEVHGEWIAQLQAAGVQVCQAESPDGFEASYRAAVYAYVVAITNQIDRIRFWKTDVPRKSCFCANWVQPDGKIGLLTRLYVGAEALNAPATTEEPQTASGERAPAPADVAAWFKKVIECLGTCLGNFINALPDDMQVKVTVKISSTPPGVDIEYEISGTSGQMKQVVHALIDLVKCAVGCVL